MKFEEKRACHRVPVHLEVSFYCRDTVHDGTALNISEKGMFIGIKEMCFPFEALMEVMIPCRNQVLHVSVHLRRIEMSPDSQDGIGVELFDPSEEYSQFVNVLRAAR